MPLIIAHSEALAFLQTGMSGFVHPSISTIAVCWRAPPPVHTLQLVKQCNEGAHKMERTEQMYTLHTQLDFSKVKVGAPNPAPAQALL